jgi:hypothetical protein
MIKFIFPCWIYINNLGIVAGLQSGVAKDAFVHPVRALACDGSGGYGIILAALDWINNNAITPAVVSMSLASEASISIDQAIINLMETKGILIVRKYLKVLYVFKIKVQ